MSYLGALCGLGMRGRAGARLEGDLLVMEKLRKVVEPEADDERRDHVRAVEDLLRVVQLLHVVLIVELGAGLVVPAAARHSVPKVLFFVLERLQHDQVIASLREKDAFDVA